MSLFNTLNGGRHWRNKPNILLNKKRRYPTIHSNLILTSVLVKLLLRRQSFATGCDLAPAGKGSMIKRLSCLSNVLPSHSSELRHTLLVVGTPALARSSIEVVKFLYELTVTSYLGECRWSNILMAQHVGPIAIAIVSLTEYRF